MKRTVLVTLFVLAPAVAFGLSEVELRQTKIQALQQQIMQTQAKATRDDVVLDASERFGRLVNTAILEAHPELEKKLERSTELKDQMRAAMKKQDLATMKEIAKELQPLTQELAPFETEAMEKHSGLATAYEVLQGLVYETMLKIDPDTEANMIAVDRLQVEIEGLQGKLRKNKPGKAPKLAKARKGFRTKVFGPTDGKAAATPPRDVFEMVKYPAPLGKNVAYVTPEKKKKGPAIVWIAGGFYWGIGPDAWLPSTRENDQSAAAFREAGVTLMRPALRGAHDNPGKSECMLGEVDDIIAAAKWLAKRDDVDPKRIYLGGHSTGGTLALLVAEQTDMFRGVFAFGPIANAAHYGPVCGQKKQMPPKEAYVRAPIEFIEHIRTPTWIIEGANGNRRAVLELLQFAPDTVFPLLVPKTDHFSVLRPASEVIAKKILADRGKKSNIALKAEEIAAAMAAKKKR